MAEQKFTRLLLSLDRFQQRLAEFMLGRYLEVDFSGDSEDDETALLPQVLLDVVDLAPRGALHHGITWMGLTRDPEPNDYRLAVTLAFTEAGITAEALVNLEYPLENSMGLTKGLTEWRIPSDRFDEFNSHRP
ncbi:hypothetical protein [Streptomyces turgidiscabies]|uniref:hypothetical protein n=1 Tax=Streptomyces turgidiscabies TaxID=85558 RepID=UPI0027D7FB2F|nr:hypothetical protein [Streptomyces turgidiscabies]